MTDQIRSVVFLVRTLRSIHLFLNESRGFRDEEYVRVGGRGWVGHKSIKRLLTGYYPISGPNRRMDYLGRPDSSLSAWGSLNLSQTPNWKAVILCRQTTHWNGP